MPATTDRVPFLRRSDDDVALLDNREVHYMSIALDYEPCQTRSMENEDTVSSPHLSPRYWNLEDQSLKRSPHNALVGACLCQCKDRVIIL